MEEESTDAQPYCFVEGRQMGWGYFMVCLHWNHAVRHCRHDYSSIGGVRRSSTELRMLLAGTGIQKLDSLTGAMSKQ